MQIHHLDLDSEPLGLGRPVVTIGNFDGLHLGHQRIIAQAIRAARRRRQPAVVLTFEPHPAKVLRPESGFRALRTLEQRLRAFERMEVDAVALVRFDEILQRTTPENFVEQLLVRILAASAVLVGPGFVFGHRRSGDFATLEALGRRHDFEARTVRGSERGGQLISSTRIRNALTEGDVAEARRLLGRPFKLDGVVVVGAGRGRKLTFPTANLETANECLPAQGVYGTRVLARGKSYRGATFIGAATTFGEDRQVFENHLLDWPGDELYGERLEVEFLLRVRGPQTFPSAEALREQIRLDIARIRRHVRL